VTALAFYHWLWAHQQPQQQQEQQQQQQQQQQHQQQVQEKQEPSQPSTDEDLAGATWEGWQEDVSYDMMDVWDDHAGGMCK
jgi:hypothetical protein